MAGNGGTGSRLRAPLERGRRMQTEIFFLFNYKILSRFVALIYFVVNEKNPKRNSTPKK